MAHTVVYSTYVVWGKNSGVGMMRNRWGHEVRGYRMFYADKLRIISFDVLVLFYFL